MTVEIGHFSLILAFALAVIQGSLPLWGAVRSDRRLMTVASGAAIGQLLFVVISFLCLMNAYIVSDFSVLNVVANSHSQKPLLYKISGVWGNHEGSLLLWVLILALFGAAVALWGRNLPLSFKARVLGVQALIATGFYLFILLTSNPFERVFPVPLEGRGLNPLLQDPGLAFHPPFLYLGYVGLSIAFSFAVAALIEGRVDPVWARWVRPWTLAAWVFLTIGIALGSWWAYYELGWGGWWFWDPVENASFMPWLVATALLHSAIVVEKRDSLKSWTVLLAIIAFSFSLLGTFLVRSGVLTSVHAFATDPERGVFILIFLCLVIGGSLTLYALKSGQLQPGGLFAPFSREGALVFNNLLLSVSTATVLLGTLYPLFLDAVTGDKVSVGPPYFNGTFIPLMIPLVIAMGVAPHLSWKRADVGAVWGRLRVVSVLSVIAALVTAYLNSKGPVMAVAGVGLGVWLLLATLQDFFAKLRLTSLRAESGGLQGAAKRVRHLPKSVWGMTFAHGGMAILILGVTASSSWQTEVLDIVKPGDVLHVAGYDFTFTGVEPVAGPNYTALRGHIQVTKNGVAVKALQPESRTYFNPPMETTEAAIHSMPGGDLFAVVGERQTRGEAEGDRWAVRLYHKPLLPWLWAGAALMVLGGLVSLTDRRLRVGAPKKRMGHHGGTNAH